MAYAREARDFRHGGPMNESDPARRARREALQHVMTVLGMAAALRNAGQDERAVLLAAREQIAARGIPGQPGSPEFEAGAAERKAILDDLNAALRGENQASGYGPLTWAEKRIQERLTRLLF